MQSVTSATIETRGKLRREVTCAIRMRHHHVTRLQLCHRPVEARRYRHPVYRARAATNRRRELSAPPPGSAPIRRSGSRAQHHSCDRLIAGQLLRRRDRLPRRPMELPIVLLRNDENHRLVAGAPRPAPRRFACGGPSAPRPPSLRFGAARRSLGEGGRSRLMRAPAPHPSTSGRGSSLPPPASR